MLQQRLHPGIGRTAPSESASEDQRAITMVPLGSRLGLEDDMDGADLDLEAMDLESLLVRICCCDQKEE
jgi:hypothetical protein